MQYIFPNLGISKSVLYQFTQFTFSADLLEILGYVAMMSILKQTNLDKETMKCIQCLEFKWDVHWMANNPFLMPKWTAYTVYMQL